MGTFSSWVKRYALDDLTPAMPACLKATSLKFLYLKPPYPAVCDSYTFCCQVGEYQGAYKVRGREARDVWRAFAA